MENLLLGLPYQQTSGLDVYWNQEQVYCSICLKTGSDTTLLKYSAVDFFNSLQVVEFFSPWVCRWCHAKLKTFHSLKSKALRAYAFLNHVRLGVDHIQNNFCHFSAEVAEIKREAYSNSDTIIAHVDPNETTYPVLSSTKKKIKIKEKKLKYKSKKKKEKRLKFIKKEAAKRDKQKTMDAIKTAEANELCSTTDREQDVAVSVLIKQEMDEVPEEASDENYMYGRAADDAVDVKPMLNEDGTVAEVSQECHSDNIENSGERVEANEQNNAKRIYDQSDSEDNRIDVKPTINEDGTMAGVSHGFQSENAESDERVETKRRENGKKKSKKSYDKLDPQNSNLPDMTNNVELLNLSPEELAAEYTERLNSERYINASHKCSHCALAFAFQDSYDAHMKIHSPSAGAFECDICHSYLANEHARYQHRLRHFRRYKCRACGLVGKDGKGAYYHYISNHSNILISCDQCHKKFKRPAYLAKHIRMVHERKKDKKHACTECDKRFQNPYTLKLHMVQHDGSLPTPRAVECAHCGKQFKAKAELAAHVRRHAEAAAVPLCCAHCMKVFQFSRKLREHVLRHHTPNTWKYQCNECGKFFYTKPEIRNHILWTHDRLGGYDCDRCERKFRTQYLLRQHTSTVHDKIPQPKDKFCEVCGKGFADRQVLRKHVLYVHEREKKHICPDCGVGFQQRCDMRKHYKVKHLNISGNAQIPSFNPLALSFKPMALPSSDLSLPSSNPLVLQSSDFESVLSAEFQQTE